MYLEFFNQNYSFRIYFSVNMFQYSRNSTWSLRISLNFTRAIQICIRDICWIQADRNKKFLFQLYRVTCRNHWLKHADWNFCTAWFEFAIFQGWYNHFSVLVIHLITNEIKSSINKFFCCKIYKTYGNLIFIG